MREHGDDEGLRGLGFVGGGVTPQPPTPPGGGVGPPFSLWEKVERKSPPAVGAAGFGRVGCGDRI